MSLESNHAAAGTAATTARGEMKAEWYKKPTALHFAIGAGLIALALIINFSFEFNLFWKLLLGSSVMWVGGQLKAQTVSVAKTWGTILRGLGALIIIIALLNSGVRAVAETAVVKADKALSGLAAGKVEVPSLSDIKNRMADRYIEVDLRRLNVGEYVDVQMDLMTTLVVRLPMFIKGRDDGVAWPCTSTIHPVKLPFAPKLKVVAGAYTSQNNLALTEASRIALIQNGTPNITVRVQLGAGEKNPCVHTS